MTDYYAEALRLVDASEPCALPEAQIHATLALAEQQRIANLFRALKHTTGEEAMRKAYCNDATAALTAALPLLLPTREQIAQAIFDSPTGEDWYACQEAADAVLALIGDPPCCAHPKCPGGSICCCQKEGD